MLTNIAHGVFVVLALELSSTEIATACGINGESRHLAGRLVHELCFGTKEMIIDSNTMPFVDIFISFSRAMASITTLSSNTNFTS